MLAILVLLLCFLGSVQLDTQGIKSTSDPIRNGNIFDAVKFGNIETVRVLVNSQNVNANDGDYQSLLHTAVLNNQEKIAELLIERGANVNEDNLDGQTPLHLAIRKENPKMVNLLLKSGSDANLEDLDRNTPLDLAQQTGNTEMIRLLEPVTDST